MRQSNLVLGLYYCGRLLHYGILSCLLLHILPEVGLRGVYRGIHHIAYLLASFDFGEAVIRYFVDFKQNPQKKRGFLGWILVATTLWYLLFAGLILLFCHQLSHHSVSQLFGYLPVIFLIGYLVALSIALKAWYTALRSIVWPNFLQHVVLQCTTLFILLGYHYRWYSFASLTLLSTLPFLFHLVAMVGYLWLIGEWQPSLDPTYLSPAFVYRFFIYALYVGLASKGMVAIIRVDTMMLASQWGDQCIGHYTDLIVVVNLLDIPLKVTRQAFTPLLAESMAMEDHEKTNQGYRINTQRQLLLSSFVFALLVAALPYLLPSGKLATTQICFLILGIAKVAGNLFSISGNILLLSPYFRYSLLNLAMFALALVTDWLLIKFFGTTGAALGIFCAIVGVGTLNTGMVWYLLGIHPFTSKTGWTSLLLLTTLLLLYQLPHHPCSWIDLGRRILTVFCLFGGVGWWTRIWQY